GTSCIHFIVAPNQIDQRQVARSVLRFRVNVVHFFCWLGATHADRRLPIPKRPVPDHHSLQVLLQPVLLAEFPGLTKRRSSERQNRLTVDLQHEDGRRWRLGLRWHHHLNLAFLGWLRPWRNSVGPLVSRRLRSVRSSPVADASLILSI